MKNKLLFLLLALVIATSTFGGIYAFASDEAPEVAVNEEATAPKASFYGATLVLSNTIQIRYIVNVENVTNYNDISVLVWKTAQDEYVSGTQDYTLTYSGKTTNIGGGVKLPSFDFNGVGPQKLADDFYAVVALKTDSGTEYSTPAKYGVLNYAYARFGKLGNAASTDENLKLLLSEMLEYGAASQKYTSYKADRLATADFYQIKTVGGKLSDGFTSGFYLPDDTVVITAPSMDENGASFSHWVNESGVKISNKSTDTITVIAANQTYTPVYIKYSDKLEFDSNGDGTCYIVGSGECDDTSLVIPPKSPNGDVVIGIGESAFAGKTFSTIWFPDTILEIGRNAFINCNQLSNIYYNGSEDEWGSKVILLSGNDSIHNATKHFNKIVKLVNVKFVDYDGSIIKEDQIISGYNAIAPDIPERAGYIFTGWDKSFNSVTTDLVITAQYEVAKTYTINYCDTLLNMPDFQRTYYSNDGLVKTVDLEKEGYRFVGWTEKQPTQVYPFEQVPTDLNLVSRISSENEKNYTLYANWEIIEYKITYKDAPKNDNPIRYTVEDSIVLKNPEWSGLSFSHWTDNDGEIICEIEKGTIGDIALTANWKYSENFAVPSDNSNYMYIYDEKNAMYHFIIDVGTIYNVVLNTYHTHRFDGTNKYSKTDTITLSAGESIVSSVNSSVSNSMSLLDEFSEFSSLVENSSTTINNNFSYCPEIEFSGIKAKIFEYSNGKIQYDASSYTEEQESIHIYEKGKETTQTIGSQISRFEYFTKSFTETFELDPAFSPKGLYSWVYAGNVDVYAIVTYDPEEGQYYLNLFSIISKTYDSVLYETLPEFNMDVNIVSDSSMSLKVPKENFEKIKEEVYYICYDANGGEGEMPISIFKHGTAQSLIANKYTKIGYKFSGWYDSVNDMRYDDTSIVSDLVTGGNTITLQAIWTPNNYTVFFDYNGGNALKESMAVTYDSTYANLPNPERTHYIFKGWMYGNEMIKSESVVKTDSNHTLTAQWQAKIYNIKYETNGGAFENLPTNSYTINNAIISIPEIIKETCVFCGWYLDEDFTTQFSITELAENPRDITLYAKWSENDSRTFENIENMWANHEIKVLSLLIDSNKIEEYYSEGYKARITATYTIDGVEQPRDQSMIEIWIALNSTVEIIPYSNSIKYSGAFAVDSYQTKSGTLVVEIEDLRELKDKYILLHCDVGSNDIGYNPNTGFANDCATFSNLSINVEYYK